MEIDGRIALVTGGSSGIGAATCEQLAAEGARVAVVASSDLSKAQSVVDKINSTGGAASAFTCDVSDAYAVKSLVEDVETQMGPVDILINSAGVYYSTPVGDTDAASVDRIVDII